MFSDNTLTPKEAIRLCALGTLAAGAASYADLAMSVRHFVSRIAGPSPEIMGHSIELLKYEGMVEAEGGGDAALLSLTDAGRDELRQLLTTNVRAAPTELNKLIIALKFRFLHVLEAVDRETQVDLLIDVYERELARLDDLRRHHADDCGFLVPWLDHDIATLERRVVWLGEFREGLAAGG